MNKKIYSCMDDFDPNSILIEDALKVIYKISKKIKNYEYVELKDSYNRVIFENIKSRLKVPNYDNSAMDGYALNIKDTKNNKIFNVIGKSLAGSPSKKLIRKNQCIKIMTGAVIPKSCNVVIMKEEVELLNLLAENQDPLNLSEGVTTLFQAKDGGRIGFQGGSGM